MFIAMLDVAVDGLMVIQQRKDPKWGSEDLQSYSFIMKGVGGVFGACAGAVIT